MPTKPTHKPKAPRQPCFCRHGDRAYTRIRGRWIPLGTWGTPEAEAAYDKTFAEYVANGRRPKEPEPTPVAENANALANANGIAVPRGHFSCHWVPNSTTWNAIRCCRLRLHALRRGIDFESAGSASLARAVFWTSRLR